MFALDTNSISYYFRGEPAAVNGMQALPPSQLSIPSVVIYELKFGLMRLPDEAAAPRLQALAQFISAIKTLPFDDASASAAATIRADLERAGEGIGRHDVLIAATALANGATLITRNTREFSRVSGLTVLNWYDN